MSYIQLYAQLERTIAIPSSTPYTKSFTILFCILLEVIINIDCDDAVAFHKITCETLLANYVHHLCTLLQTGSIEDDSDFKELQEIVGFIQEDVARPSEYNKKMIAGLVGLYCGAN
jgi:hypothetical protein